MPVTVDDIRAAAGRIGDFIYHSPCPYSLSLSRLCGAEVYCKLDHLQITGSFKERGARNRLMRLTGEQRRAGVIAASAGNHALGLSYHGQLLQVPVTVVMPRWAPLVKVSNCRSFGAQVVLYGETFDDARAHAIELGKQYELTFIPAFDDADIIAGQGTMGLEILEDLPEVDAIFVPVGGGGLVAGIATVVRAVKPSVKVIGVESRAAPTLYESLRAGAITRVPSQPTLADGLAVAQVGALPFAIAREKVDRVVLVDEIQIAKAILRLLELEKMVVEGAGAVPLAAAMDRNLIEDLGLAGKNIVLALCGGNIDVTMIARIIDRGLASDGRLARITVHISDRPGSLARVLAILGEIGASVKEVEHDRHFGPADVALAAVRLTLETRDAAHVEEMHAALVKAGVPFHV